MSGAAGASLPRNFDTPEMHTTPPVAAQALICSSVMLRPCSASASGLAWLNTTGWRECAMMSSVVRRSVWAQSISTPALFTASTMRRPQCREALRWVVAAAGHAVVAVVGEMNLSHPQVAVQRHHLGPLQQGQRALQIKAHCEFSLVAGALQVRYGCMAIT